MKIPSDYDFLEMFGLSPDRVDDELVSQYTYHSIDTEAVVTLSFSEVYSSFKIILDCNKKTLVTISSDCLEKIDLFEDKRGRGVNICFNYLGLLSQATLILEPMINLDWSVLRG